MSTPQLRQGVPVRQSNKFEKFLTESGILNKVEDFRIFRPGVKSAYKGLAYKLIISNTFITRQVVQDEIEANCDLKNKLEAKLAKQQMSHSSNDQVDQSKKKRFRRVAQEIQKEYKCPIPECSRSYGSEGSLNQHIKIKHPNLQELLG